MGRQVPHLPLARSLPRIGRMTVTFLDGFSAMLLALDLLNARLQCCRHPIHRFDGAFKRRNIAP
jgi:hypothetical protein